MPQNTTSPSVTLETAYALSLRVDLPATTRSMAIRFDVPRGSILGVQGPSGVGKTTMLRMIADLDRHEGSVHLGDQAHTDLSGPAWRRHVMYVDTNAGWWADTVADHFDRLDEIKPLMDRVDLSAELLTRQPQTLSSGERQRMALIRALVRKPVFLLLDEPTSALDEETTLSVEMLLLDAKTNGTGMVIVTHDAAQSARLADQTYMMRRA